MPLMESLSGIRGIWNKDLNEKITARYAYSYFSFVKNKIKSPVIVVGRDTRLSGKIIRDTVIEALDCNIIDAGIMPTPVIQLAVREFNANGGIIITASHNEPYWNGFKFLRGDGAVLSGEEMAKVIKIFRGNKEIKRKGLKKVVINKNYELVKRYKGFVANIIGKLGCINKSKFKIVIDPNGGTGAIAKKIYESLGIRVIGLNMDNGAFNRSIEPNEESLVYLTNVIKENNADFAVGFDCDADRAEILLPDGSIVSGNYILALVAKYILSSINAKGRVVVVNDATSKVVGDVVNGFGAKIVEVGVGEINVVDEMIRQNAVLGGEGSSSGVIIPPSTSRDGILATAFITSLLSKEGKKLNDILEDLPKYYTLSKKIKFDTISYNKTKDFIVKHYLNKGCKIRSLNDSIKVIIDNNSFVWFRASKTEQDIFRIIADSDKKQKSESLLNEATKVVENAKRQ